MKLQIASSYHKVLKICNTEFSFKICIIFKQVENAEIRIEKYILLYLISILQMLHHIYLNYVMK